MALNLEVIAIFCSLCKLFKKQLFKLMLECFKTENETHTPKITLLSGFQNHSSKKIIMYNLVYK